jgi:predicted nucleic acid-binding Zn ribbon protein
MTSQQLRARVIAEWRGLPETPFPKDTSKALDGIVLKVMDSLGLKERLREEEVLKAWGEIVGEFVALHSHPQRLRDGILTVHVLQPTVRYELDRIWKRDILGKLKARFGVRTVKDIKFQIG